MLDDTNYMATWLVSMSLADIRRLCLKCQPLTSVSNHGLTPVHQGKDEFWEEKDFISFSSSYQRAEYWMRLPSSV